MEIWSLKAVGWGRMMIGLGKKFQKTRRFLRNFSKINMNENAGLFLTPNRELGLVPFLVFEKNRKYEVINFILEPEKVKIKKLQLKMSQVLLQLSLVYRESHLLGRIL